MSLVGVAASLFQCRPHTDRAHCGRVHPSGRTNKINRDGQAEDPAISGQLHACGIRTDKTALGET